MNGRVAKKLRRLAKLATVGQPAVAYSEGKRRQRAAFNGMGPNGMQKVVQFEITGTVRLARNTTRHAYKTLKRAMKKERQWRAIQR